MVTVALAVKDGFSPKLKAALDKVGLADSWDTVKPHLGKIGSTISERASYLTFSLLQKLAARFPGISSSEAGFLTARVEAMAEVFHEKSVPNDLIEQRIVGLVQAADDTSSPDDIATTADVATYRDEGAFQVEINTKRQMLLYFDDTGTSREISSKYLQNFIPGFNPDQAASIAVHYQELGVTVYHYYTGRYDNWVPKVPEDLAVPGDVLTISVDILTKDGFVKSIPKMTMTNDAGISWVSNQADASFSLTGDNLMMQVNQDPAIEGVSSFAIDGTSGSLSNSNGDTFVKFSIANVVDDPRTLKVTFDGYGTPLLSISSGSNFNPITLISSDGVRLRIVSNSGDSAATTSTLYLQDPSVLFSPKLLVPTEQFTVPGVSNVYLIDQVAFNRGLESSILKGSNYDAGRIGAEIAYTIAEKNLNLRDVILPEISQGGKDVYTSDGGVFIQARMMVDLTGSSPDEVTSALKAQLAMLVDKLQTDYQYNPGAQTSYAVLSWLDPSSGVVKTIVAQVPKP